MHELDGERWPTALGLIDSLAEDAVALLRGNAESSTRERWARFIDSQLALAEWIGRSLSVGQAPPSGSEPRLALAFDALDEAVTRLRRMDDPIAGAVSLFAEGRSPSPLKLGEALTGNLPEGLKTAAGSLLVVTLLKESRAVAAERLISPSTESLGDLVFDVPDFSPHWDDEESFQTGAAARFLKKAEETLDPPNKDLLRLLVAALQDREWPEALFYAAGRAGVPAQQVADLLLLLRRRSGRRGSPTGSD